MGPIRLCWNLSYTWIKWALTCACSPLLLWSWYSRKFHFVQENVRHTCKKVRALLEGLEGPTHKHRVEVIQDKKCLCITQNIPRKENKEAKPPKPNTVDTLEKSHLTSPTRAGKIRTPESHTWGLSIPHFPATRKLHGVLRLKRYCFSITKAAQAWKGVRNLDFRIILTDIT